MKTKGRGLGYCIIKADSIIVPEDFTDRMKSVDPALVKSIEEHDIINPPLVRRRDRRLIAGEDRLAAMMALAWPKVTVNFCECSDEEIPLLRDAENCHRRHSVAERDAAMLRYIDALSKREGRPMHDDPDHKPVGRPLTPRGVARRQLAQERGVNPESIRQAEFRAQKRGKPSPNKEAPPPEPPPDKSSIGIDLLGLEPHDSFIAQVGVVKKYMTEALRKVRGAMHELKSLRSAGVPLHETRLEQIEDELTTIAHRLDGAMPVSTCPLCKGVDPPQTKCGQCVTTGYILKQQQKDIPKEYLDQEKRIVLFEGKKRLMEEFLEAPKAEDDDPGSIWG